MRFKRGWHKQIPGSCSFNGMYVEMVENAPKKGAVFVEIGCWKGRSAAFMGVEIINSGKKITFFTVDHFEGSVNHGNDPDVKAGTLEQTARANLAPLGGVVNVIAKRSTEAAADFAGGSIDFLFIDGQHDYENVKADLLAWLPKMKRPGGIIAGDDANWPGVKEAAREVLGEASISVIEPHPKGRYWRAAPLA
jgi:predicted O-methyltransferase YrrM